MSANRVSVVLDAMARVDGAAPTMVDRVCRATVVLLGLTGAGITLMVRGRPEGSAGTVTAGIAELQELQLALGEGPCVDAWARNEPVGEPDLADPATTRWPAFARAAVEAGVGAVFAFPMHQGAIRVGALLGYRAATGPLSGEETARAVVLADIGTQVVLAAQSGAPHGELHELLSGEPPHWAEVHQATGMVSAQLGVPVDEAFVRLRAHAFVARRPLRDVARDVVARRLRLEAP